MRPVGISIYTRVSSIADLATTTNFDLQKIVLNITEPFSVLPHPNIAYNRCHRAHMSSAVVAAATKCSKVWTGWLCRSFWQAGVGSEKTAL